MIYEMREMGKMGKMGEMREMGEMGKMREMGEMGTMGERRGDSGLYSTVNRYKRLSRELDIFTLLGLTHCNGILSS